MSQSSQPRNYKMRRSDLDEQSSEVIKSKLYINEVLVAYQQLKAEKYHLQQQLSAAMQQAHESPKRDAGCQQCSAALSQLKALQTENKMLQAKLAKETAEKEHWKKQHNAVVELLRDAHSELSSARDELQSTQQRNSKHDPQISPVDSPRSFLSGVLKRTKASSQSSSGATSFSYSVGENSDDCTSPPDQYGISSFLHPHKEDVVQQRSSSRRQQHESQQQQQQQQQYPYQQPITSHDSGDSSKSSGWTAEAQVGERSSSNNVQQTVAERISPEARQHFLPRAASNPRRSTDADYRDHVMASPENLSPVSLSRQSNVQGSLRSPKEGKYTPRGLPIRQQPASGAAAAAAAAPSKQGLWSNNSNFSRPNNAPVLSHPSLHQHASPSSAPRATMAVNPLHSAPIDAPPPLPQQLNSKSKKAALYSQPHTYQKTSPSPKKVKSKDPMDDDLPYHCVQPASPNWKAIHVGHMHPPQVLRVHVSPDDTECIMDAEVYEGEVAQASEAEDSAEAYSSSFLQESSRSNLDSGRSRPKRSSMPSLGLTSARSSGEWSNQQADLVASMLQSIRSGGGQGGGDHLHQLHDHQAGLSSSRNTQAKLAQLGSHPSMVSSHHRVQERGQGAGGAAEERVRGGAYWDSQGGVAGKPQWGGSQSARGGQVWQQLAARAAAAARTLDSGKGSHRLKELQHVSSSTELHRRLRGELPSYL